MKSLHKGRANPAAEGTIQFRFDLTPGTRADWPGADQFALFVSWRRILRRLKLVGRDARRYDGYGYGNLSMRDTQQPARFFISASQTSGAAAITPRDVVRIDRWNADRFEVAATGDAPPSSESITHGMLYAADPAIHWIMHAHSHEIWAVAGALGLPTTAAAVTYGSPAMAAAVADLMARHRQRPLVFATLGHLDGIFACGAGAASAGSALVNALALAYLQR
jgi:ribulose-5-phosphate 4-epimerase/fuculose-1-phosphate aldolase